MNVYNNEKKHFNDSNEFPFNISNLKNGDDILESNVLEALK